MSDDDDLPEAPKKPRARRAKKPPAVVGDNLDAVGAPRLWAWLKDEWPQASVAAGVVGFLTIVSIYKSRPYHHKSEA